MATAKNISYSKRGNDDGPAVSGTFTAEFPESLEEAITMWGGDAVVLSKVVQSVTIDMQGVARRVLSAKDGSVEKVQETINKYVPGLATNRSSDGMSNAAMAKALKALAQEDPERYKEIMGDLQTPAPAEATESAEA